MNNRLLNAETNAVRAELPNVLGADPDMARDVGLCNFSVIRTPQTPFV